jgi:hypothetical protein
MEIVISPPPSALGGFFAHEWRDHRNHIYSVVGPEDQEIQVLLLVQKAEPEAIFYQSCSQSIPAAFGAAVTFPFMPNQDEHFSMYVWTKKCHQGKFLRVKYHHQARCTNVCRFHLLGSLECKYIGCAEKNMILHGHIYDYISQHMLS